MLTSFANRRALRGISKVALATLATMATITVDATAHNGRVILEAPAVPTTSPGATTDAVVNTNYYSLADPTEAGEKFGSPAWLWKAVEADAAAAGMSADDYIARVNKAWYAFRDSRKVVGFEATKKALLELGGAPGGTGRLLFMTGGTNEGKSVMLGAFARETARSGQRVQVVYMDSRLHSTDVLRGLVWGLAKDPILLRDVQRHLPFADGPSFLAMAEREAHFQKRLQDDGSNVPHPLVSVVTGAAWSAGLACGLLQPELTVEKLLDSIVGACGERGERPVVIIDQAGIQFDRRWFIPADLERSERLLGTLRSLTRRAGAGASVVLVNSDHELPYTLAGMAHGGSAAPAPGASGSDGAAPAAGAGVAAASARRGVLPDVPSTGNDGDSDVFDGVLFTGDVPPPRMRPLLVDEWGCGPALTAGLLAMYGGNVYYTGNALMDLARMKSAFRPSVAVGLRSCYVRDTTHEDVLVRAGAPRAAHEAVREVVRRKLAEISVRGYVLLENSEVNDPWVKAAVLSHKACVVPRDSAEAGIVFGVDPAAWTATLPDGTLPARVLVPPSYLVRVMLAGEYVARR